MDIYNTICISRVYKHGGGVVYEMKILMFTFSR